MEPLSPGLETPAEESVARRWARRLIHLCGDPPPTVAARAELWVLVSAALDHFIALHARRLGAIDRETREDLVSEKASDLMARIEGGGWRPAGESPDRVAAFVSSTARNGLVDHLRRHGARTSRAVSEEDGAFDFERLSAGPEADPSTTVRQEEFVVALLDCVAALPERQRRIWRLRVLHELSTRHIAAHPAVGLSAANVDVILYRVRKTVRSCMAGKEMDRVVPPPGTFACLWDALRRTVDRDEEEES